MSKWRAEWSGSYPNHCSGEWSLYRDDVCLDVTIPFNGRSRYDSTPAGTEGFYRNVGIYRSEGDWKEFDEEYFEGTGCFEWIEEHREWLATVAPQDEWPAIYNAFNVSDWRYGQCGGCI